MADPQSSAVLSTHPRLPDGAPRAGVIHIRHRHMDRYTVVGNHLAQHPRLSATAIGFGVYIQSLPEGASVTVKSLTLRFREGETTVRRALNELEAAGYLERRRVPLGGGRVATRTFFYDRPGCVPEGTGTPKATPRPRSGSTASTPLSATAVGASSPVPPRPEPKPEVGRNPRPQPPQTSPPPPAQGPATDLLARLRLADPRLLLSTRDVHRLAPAVEAWLSRSATPDQITRTLTAGLPPEPVPIHHPARFLEHRLVTLLPPPLPPTPSDRPAATTAVTPLQTCDGCDRAFRSHDPTARCRDCRRAALRGTSESEHHRYAELACPTSSAATGSHRRETAC